MRLLAIHAHPDDESSKGAAATARYAAEGHEVLVLTCTGGERGEVLNPKFDRRPQSLSETAALRRAEMAESARILGVAHEWLGFVDSGMDEGPSPDGSFAAHSIDEHPDGPLAKAVAVVRRFRPHVIVTYDENGGYPHPDHLMTHRVSIAAFHAAADPDAFAEAGPAWRTAKLYYMHFATKEGLTAVHEAMLHHGLDSPYGEWLDGWDDSGNRIVTTRVECSAYFDTRRRALLAHASQIDPESNWFNIPLEVQERAWPTEDFEAALSFVPIVPIETDLFAGLGSPSEPLADAIGTATGLHLAYDTLTPVSEQTTTAGATPAH